MLGLALDLVDYNHSPPVIVGSHLTCKIVPEMTYNVSTGTINPAVPNHCAAMT